VREGIAAVISIVILVITVWMLAVTFNTGRETGEAQSPAKLDAYNRQKDMLLYALALLQ
jgi:hypothetical protein